MLQKNERSVLLHLCKNARTTDSAIAEDIGVSTQAVGKIRRKLEAEGVIRGYHVDLDPEKIGLMVTTLAVFQVPPAIMENDHFAEPIKADPHTTTSYRLMHGGANVMTIFAFRSLQEAEEYFLKRTKEYPNVHVVNLQTTSWNCMLKNSTLGAYQLVLEDKPQPPAKPKHAVSAR